MSETTAKLLLPYPAVAETDTPDVPRDIKALAVRLDEALASYKSIIATEQARTNVAFGAMATPDEVSVVLPTNGLIVVAFQAMWQHSVASTGRAAIFVGANQVKIAPTSGAGAPIVQEASLGAAINKWASLSSFAGGIESTAAGEYTGDVTTGQIIGGNNSGSGVCYIEAAAGTYKIAVQYKSSSGEVKVKNRKLRAWVIA